MWLRSTALTAGSNTVLDIVAARVVERSHIPLVVLDGRDPENLKKALIDGICTGTVVSEQRQSPLPP
jgi:uridylate kinase